MAACKQQLQARRGLGLGAPQSSRSSAPPRSMSRVGPSRPARLRARPLWDASSHLASRPQPAPLAPEPLPPTPALKSAINFPSLPPPCSAPATQTPPPDAPSLTSRLAQPPPSRPRPAAHPPSTWGRQDPCTPYPRPYLDPRPHLDPRERREALPGAQGMNILVLVKLPSADVMAPAAVATRRIPQRARRKPKEGAPGACWNLAPQGRPLSRRGVGAWPASRWSRASSRRGKRSREA